MKRISFAGTAYLELFLQVVFLIFSILMLIMPALENGYPILHTDSGSYLLMGYGNKIPVSRPITYPIFVRFSSLQFSAWFTIVFQSLFTYWIIYQTIKTFFPKKPVPAITFLAVSILSLTTGLSHYTSQIMPDIFLPLALLGYFILLVRAEIPKLTLIPLVVLTFLSSILHMSSIPVLTGTLLALAFISIVAQRKISHLLKRRYIMIALMVGLAWVTIPSINSIYKEGFKMSTTSNIVFFSRLLDGQIAQGYILDRCETDTAFKLCKYKDELEKYDRFDKFLWNDDSFLYDEDTCMGIPWDHCWKIRDEEFGQINQDILGHRKYFRMYLGVVFHDFLEQIISFRQKHFIPLPKGGGVDFAIQKYYAHDRKAFFESRQMNGTLYYNQLNDIQFFTIIFSVLILVIFLFSKGWDKLFKRRVNDLQLLILMSILVSSMLTAITAVVSGRFTGRLIWLLPLVAIMVVYEAYLQKIGKDA
jgi:hypothetical protein